MKKILALVLSVLMVFSVVTPVFAAAPAANCTVTFSLEDETGAHEKTVAAGSTFTIYFYLTLDVPAGQEGIYSLSGVQNQVVYDKRYLELKSFKAELKSYENAETAHDDDIKHDQSNKQYDFDNDGKVNYLYANATTHTITKKNNGVPIKCFSWTFKTKTLTGETWLYNTLYQAQNNTTLDYYGTDHYDMKINIGGEQTVQYTVTYDYNGGSEGTASEKVNSGSSVTLPTTTRDGLDFAGWKTDKGALVAATSTTYQPIGDVTLTAQWKAKTPTGLEGVKPSTVGGSDGYITGVDSTMEYKAIADFSYKTCSDTQITGLPAGEYKVRVKKGTDYAESDSVTVIVPDATPEGVAGVCRINDTGYDTLAAAIEAAKTGDTIVLLTDISAPLTTPFDFKNKEISLDLSGFGLKGKSENATGVTVNNIPRGECMIGEKCYETLADAIEAAKSGDAILLLKDVSGSVDYNNKEVLIDKNGFAYNPTELNSDNVGFVSPQSYFKNIADFAAIGVYKNDVSPYAADGYDAKKTTVDGDTLFDTSAPGTYVVKVIPKGTDRDPSTDVLDVYAGDMVDVDIVITGARSTGAKVTIAYDMDLFEDYTEEFFPGWGLNDMAYNEYCYYDIKSGGGYWEDGYVLGRFTFEAQQVDQTTLATFVISDYPTYVSNSYKIGGSPEAADPLSNDDPDHKQMIDGKVNIVVEASVVSLEGISIKESTTLAVGQTETLIPEFTPTNATNKKVTWNSNNLGVATVDSTGKITAVAPGTATITVTSEDGGFTDTCIVTVVAKTPSLSGTPTATVKYGDTVSDAVIKGTVTALDGTTPVAGTIKWTDDVKSSGYGNATGIGTKKLKGIFVPDNTTVYAPVEIDVVVTVEKADITLTANDYNKAYTGKDVAVVDISNKTAKLNGNDVPGTWKWDDGTDVKNVSDSGKKTLIFVPSDRDNYNDAQKDINVTISQVELTPVVKSVSDKTYNGDTEAVGTIEFNGAVNGETPNGTATFAWTSKNAGTSTVNVSNIALGSGWTENYKLSSETLTNASAGKTIQPKILTKDDLQYNSIVTKVYDGNTSCTLTSDITLRDGVLCGSDTLSIEISSVVYNSANVAEAEYVTVTPKAITMGNYRLTSDQKLKIDATITKAEQQPQIVPTNSLYKGGKTIDLSKMVGGAYGDVSFSISSGTAATIEADGKTLKSSNETGDVVITVLVAGDANHMPYTGTNAITVTVIDKADAGASFAKEVASEMTYGDSEFTLEPKVATPGTNGKWTYESTDPSVLSVDSNGKVTVVGVGEAVITARYDSDTTFGNVSATVTVNPKEVKINGLEVKDKVYDGTTFAEIIGTPTLTGVVSGDKVSVEAGSARFGTEDAGLDKTVLFEGYTLSGEDAKNYILVSQPEKTRADITAKEVTINDLGAVTRIYNGTKTVELIGGILSGTVDGTDVAFSIADAVGTMTDANVGNGKSVTVSGVKLVGEDARNYKLKEQPKNVTVDITKAPAPELADRMADQKFDDVNEKTVSVANLMPDDAGSITYELDVEATTGAVSVVSKDVNSRGEVSYKLADGETGNTVTIPVIIHSKNYEDAHVNINIALKNIDVPEITVPALYTKVYDGTAVTIEDLTEDAETSVPGTWSFKTIESLENVADSGIKTLVFTPDEAETYATVEVNVNVQIEKAPKAAPTGLEGTLPTSSEATDGKITGVTTEMEYRLVGDVWSDCPEGTIPNLGSGSYEVRYKESENYFASDSTTVTIKYTVIPVYGDQEKIKVDATIIQESATLVIDDPSELDKVIKEDVNTGILHIDATAIEEEIKNIEISADVFTKINTEAQNENNDVEALKLEMTNGKMELNKEAIAAINEQAEGCGIRLVIDDVEQKELKQEQQEALKSENVAAIYDVYVETIEPTPRRLLSEEVGNAKTGITVRHKLEEGRSVNSASVLYVDENGTKTVIPHVQDKNDKQYILFTIAHYSNYVVTYKDNGGGRSGGGGTSVVKRDITVLDTTNGKVVASENSAAAGKVIKLTVVPDKGYVLSDIKVTDEKNNDITVTSGEDGNYSFKMPNANVTVRAEFAAEDESHDHGYGDCPRDETCPIEPFTDTENDYWWHDGIHYCVEEGLMVGFPGSVFKPNDSLSRAQIVTILWRMEGSPAADYAMSFGDVDVAEWYGEAIRWAQSTNVVLGYNDYEFGPNDSITREQLAAILHRYANFKGIDVSARADLANFNDANTVSDWAVENVKWAVASEMVNGRTETTIVPLGYTTRAEAAAMIQRFCVNIIKK